MGMLPGIFETNQVKTISEFYVASYKKSLYHTFYNKISNKLIKTK